MRPNMLIPLDHQSCVQFKNIRPQTDGGCHFKWDTQHEQVIVSLQQLFPFIVANKTGKHAMIR